MLEPAPAPTHDRRRLTARRRATRARAHLVALALALGVGPGVCGVIAPGVVGPAQAQSGPTLGEAVTEWARGNWASPVFCRIGGQTVRGIRRVLIEPSKNPLPGRTELDLRFVDMQVDDAERCFDVIGTEVPNLTGRIQLRFNGTSHSETVRRDFERALRRDRGFVFDVVHGGLRLHVVAPGDPVWRVQDMKGTQAWIRTPARSSDSARALSEFESRRKLELEIAEPDGTSYRLPLFLTEQR